MQYDHTEYRVVESYDSQTGILTFTEPLSFYHWGQRQSTADEYRGIDMRGEVILLSRNVRIVGENVDSWGGQILVADNYEIESEKQRIGHLTMDHVEVYNCSQRQTFKSAIRFETALFGHSHIKNSVVHGSLAWSFGAQYSANIAIESSAFIGARAVAVNVFGSNNVTIDNAIAGDVV